MSTIRPERPGDLPEIARVVEAAFESPTEAELVAALRASSSFVPDWSLVAEEDGQVVGHVMVSYASLQGDGTEWRIASLAPLAVAPGSQGRGIGSALVREVTTRADSHGEPLVVLQGSPVFYGRLGFEHSEPWGIHMTLPTWAPAEAAQVLRLRAYDPAMRGRLVYPAAFGEIAET